MHTPRARHVALVSLVATACATAPVTRPTVGPDAGHPRIVEAPLLEQMRDLSLYQVVTRRWPDLERPTWTLRRDLTPRVERIGVYAGSLYLGSLDDIRDLRATDVTRVRRLTSNEAFYTFGRPHPYGALVLDWSPRR